MSIINTEDCAIQITVDGQGAELTMTDGDRLVHTHFSYDKFHQFVVACNRVFKQISPSRNYCAICYHPLEDGLCSHCDADLADLPLGGDLCA